MRVRYHHDPAASWEASFDNVIVDDDEIQQGIKPQQDLRDLLHRQVWIGRTDPGCASDSARRWANWRWWRWRCRRSGRSWTRITCGRCRR